MAQRHADISRDIFDEAKQYKYPIFQKGPNKPPVDADVNDGLKSFYSQIRRILEIFGRVGSPDINGFRISQSAISTINNFAILGGDGTVEGAGRMFLEGHMCMLKNTIIEWNSIIAAEIDLIHARSDVLAATVLTWNGANWIVNEYAGRTLIPNIINGTGFTIVSNTQNTITISAGDMTTVASVKDHFRIDPSTPGAPRIDHVYVDIYLDETDETEDTNLLHPIIGSLPFVSALRNRLKYVIQVRENALVGINPYTDPDGNIHYYSGIATLNRDANNTITTAEIVDVIPRDLINLTDIRTEIVGARGSMASIGLRLLVSLQADGTLQPLIVTDAEVSNTANIDQTKIDDSDTVDDSFVGTPTDLQDDLNEVRTEIKETKGTANWGDTPTQDLETLNTEVTDARGNLGTLDGRLDVSLDEDGLIKTKPLGQVIPRLFDYAGIIFVPKDTAWTTTYRLHQARGFFHSEYPNNPATQLFGPYIPYDLEHTGYPLDVQFGTGPGPGGADNTNPPFALSWYNVYVIGKDDGSLALVYSNVLRAPFNRTGGSAQGPDISAGTYDFPANGWKYWAFIGALRNGQAGSWEIVPCRKYGRHVQYEQAQQLLLASVNQATYTQLPIGSRIPETSMRANLMLIAEASSDGSVDLRVRVASVVSATEKMLLQDSAPLSPLSQDYKLRSRANSNAAASPEQTDTTGWTATDNFQRIDYMSVVTGVGTHDYKIMVLGYEEFPNLGSGEPTWP